MRKYILIALRKGTVHYPKIGLEVNLDGGEGGGIMTWGKGGVRSLVGCLYLN